MKKIMVVEDDPVTLKVFSVRLERAGFQVVSVADGRDVIDHVRTEMPDLLLLDMTLPGGGLQAVDMLKRLPLLAAIPFIFVTANRNPSYREQAIKAGAVAFMEKPVNMDELLLAIRRSLQMPVAAPV
ncbi:MAG: response regulator [Pseudomonadota bacterium]